MCCVILVAGPVALDEVVEVGARHRLGLQHVVAVGAVVVDPHLLGPRLVTAGPALEEQDVRLDALGVEDAGRQAQQRVDVALVEQLATDGLAGPAFEQNVVGDDDRRAAMDLEQ